MTDRSEMPALTLEGDEDRLERNGRLLRAYDTMCAVVRVLWPGEDAGASDLRAVRWKGALIGLHECEGHLHVAWKDEDHFGRYAKVVELGWNAAGDETGQVIHENADADGLELATEKPMF
jgi:hypothetical protein